jgi:hypothetical protein
MRIFEIVSRARTLIAAVIGVGLFAGFASAQTAEVQVIHNSPDPLAAVVDIYVDSGPTPAVDDFAFRTATGLVPLPAGVNVSIGVAPGNSTGPGDIIASFDFVLAAGERYVVMAAGVLDPGLPSNPEGIPTDFNLEVFPALRTMGTGGNVDILAFHGAPDAPSVDIRAQGVGPLFENLAFKQFSTDYLSVPPAPYTLDITPAGMPGQVVASFEADLSGLGGGAAVAFASGYLTPGAPNAFGLFAALVDGTVVEFMPVATPVEASTWGRVKTILGE